MQQWPRNHQWHWTFPAPPMQYQFHNVLNVSCSKYGAWHSRYRRRSWNARGASALIQETLIWTDHPKRCSSKHLHFSVFALRAFRTPQHAFVVRHRDPHNSSRKSLRLGSNTFCPSSNVLHLWFPRDAIAYHSFIHEEISKANNFHHSVNQRLTRIWWTRMHSLNLCFWPTPLLLNRVVRTHQRNMPSRWLYVRTILQTPSSIGQVRFVNC